MAYPKTRKLPNGDRRFDACWREDGKSRSRTFIRKIDRDRFLVEVARKAQLGTLYEAPPVTLGEAKAAWLERWELGVAPSTRARNLEAWSHYAGLEDVPLVLLTPARLTDTVTAAAKQAPRQAQIGLAMVKKILRDAQTRGQRVDPLLLTVKAPRYHEREPVFLTAGEVDLLASWSTQPRLIVFLALSGLRIGEALALREADIDLDTHSVQVARSARKGVEGRPKTRASQRRVFCCAKAWKALMEQILERPANPRGLAFPSPDGLLWNSDNFRHRVFAPAAKRTALDVGGSRGETLARLSPHDMRHSYASLMLRTGLDVGTIARQMGHSDGGGLLLRRYAHLYADAGDRAARALDAMLAEPGEAVAQ